MKEIKAKIARAYERIEKLGKQLKKIRRNLDIPCGCGEAHKIKDCDAIQTHWYTPPRGCTEGDYWSRGELQIVCPVSHTSNRILSRDTKLEKLFWSLYKDCFASVRDMYADRSSSWNNPFLDDNKEYYGLEIE